MNTYFFSPKHKPGFHQTKLTIWNIASWMMQGLASWNRFTERRALQRFEHLNDHALRDIGVWREPESRVDEWWMRNPPP
jgi:uncharacterized protein YjiS (DUF1127 family)